MDSKTGLKNTFFNLTKNMQKSSNKLIKVTKLNLTITNEEENLRSMYTQIGKKARELFLNGNTEFGTNLTEEFNQVSELELKLELLKEELNIINSTKACPSCGKANEKSSGFCSKCGAMLPSESEE